MSLQCLEGQLRHLPWQSLFSVRLLAKHNCMCVGTTLTSAVPAEQTTPAAILMGCSTGYLRVTRIDARGALSALHGPAFKFLAAGSPCVVGNLWDVTDRDIDSFTASMLTQCASAFTSLAKPTFVLAKMPCWPQRWWTLSLRLPKAHTLFCTCTRP